jgi:hypothetical protein
MKAIKTLETPGTIPEDNASTKSSLAKTSKSHASFFNSRGNTGSLDGMYK